MAWIVDLDGVVWRGGSPVPRAAAALARLREAGVRPVFLTNNSYPTSVELRQKLESFGISCGTEDLLSSAMAAAEILRPGSRALVLAGPGVVEALERRGVEALRVAPCGRPTSFDEIGDELTTFGAGAVEAVVVGIEPSAEFRGIALAAHAARGGALLVGTNDDTTFPVSRTLLPGGGALLAAVAAASGCAPVVAGKPHGATVRLVRALVPDVELVVGDRPSTDGLLARALGVPFALVHTGVTPREHGVLDPPPDLEGADLADIVERFLERAAPERRESPGA